MKPTTLGPQTIRRISDQLDRGERQPRFTPPARPPAHIGRPPMRIINMTDEKFIRGNGVEIKNQDENGYWKAYVPSADSLPNSAIILCHEIPAGAAGPASRCGDNPEFVLYEGDAPAPGDELGVQAGSLLLKKDNTGYTCYRQGEDGECLAALFRRRGFLLAPHFIELCGTEIFEVMDDREVDGTTSKTIELSETRSGTYEKLFSIGEIPKGKYTIRPYMDADQTFGGAALSGLRLDQTGVATVFQDPVIVNASGSFDLYYVDGEEEIKLFDTVDFSFSHTWQSAPESSRTFDGSGFTRVSMLSGNLESGRLSSETLKREITSRVPAPPYSLGAYNLKLTSNYTVSVSGSFHANYSKDLVDGESLFFCYEYSLSVALGFYFGVDLDEYQT